MSREKKVQKNGIGNFLAGAASGVVSKTSTAPLERIKILFQVQDMNTTTKTTPKYGRSILNCVRLIYAEEGLLGFFKGNWANVTRVMPMYAIKFTMNEKFKNLFKSPDRNALSFAQLIASGTLAALSQITSTYPLEVVRTRLALSITWTSQSKSMISCVRNIAKNEGIFGFYKGFGICILTGTPCIAIQLAVFEQLNSLKILGNPQTKGREILTKLSYGSISGILAQSITYWGDTVKRRMQSNGMNGKKKIYSNSLHCVKTIFLNEGLRGFHRGFFTNIMRTIPSAAIQLTAYDQLKRLTNINFKS